MRIIFIPGFAEDERIFSHIHPLIPGEKLLLNSWKLFDSRPAADLNVLKFAKDFIETYDITGRDVLIGHSMGGWIAYHVKHFVNCPVIQVASMTKNDRVIPPVFDLPLVYWAIRRRLVFNRFTTWMSSFGMYHHRESRDIFMYCAKLLEKGNTEIIVNQLKVIIRPVDVVLAVQPDLRIHSKEDPILKPPAEPFYNVPGDHFGLYTHPREVAEPIIRFLQGQFDAYK